MTVTECQSQADEYIYLVGSEYLDRNSGNKCSLQKLTVTESLTAQDDYNVMCELVSGTSGFIGSKIWIRLEPFLHSGRFQRIRAKSLR